MLDTNFQRELQKGGLLDDLKAVLVNAPALREVVDDFYRYLTLRPIAISEGASVEDCEPLVVACLRDACVAAHADDGKLYPDLPREDEFIAAMFKRVPDLLEQALSYFDEESGEAICWQPFAEAVSAFIDRHPSATVHLAVSESRIDPHVARLMAAARILPINRSAMFGAPGELELKAA